jgi:hypothetical protein
MSETDLFMSKFVTQETDLSFNGVFGLGSCSETEIYYLLKQSSFTYTHYS